MSRLFKTKINIKRPLNFKNIFLNFPYLELSFLLSFVFSQYWFPVLNLGTIMLIIIVCWTSFRDREILDLSLPFFFFAYCVIVKAVSLIFIPDRLHIVNFTMQLLFFTYSILKLSRDLKIDKLVKVWNFLAYIAIFGLIYHLLVLRVTGKQISALRLLPFLTYEHNTRFFELSWRPLSFFVEPALLTIFIFPIALLNLYFKKYFTAFVFTVSLILTTSTNGFVYALIIIIFLIAELIKKFRKSKLFWTLFFVILICLCLVFFLTDIFSSTLNKIQEELEGQGTFSNRVLSGFFIFANMDVFEQMFGAGYRDLVYFLSHGFIKIPQAQFGTFSYINTIGDILFSFGIFGLLLYFVFVYDIIKEHDSRFLPLIIIFFLSMISQHIFNNMSYVLVYTIMYLTKKELISNLNVRKVAIRC